jgi:hypothetical protein
VALGSWVDQEELKGIASYPHEENKIDVKNYDSLPLIRQVLIDLVCNSECMELFVSHFTHELA